MDASKILLKRHALAVAIVSAVLATPRLCPADGADHRRVDARHADASGDARQDRRGGRR